ncbi:MAG: hypothetical protein IJ047_01850 [Paludibacteraceae bacterium]|nr:hypothetical protein [Paludibacteraceae bacterium]
MRYSCWVIGLLLCVLACEAQGAKRPVTETERLARELKRSPGDMELHCRMAQAQLAEGDTAAAEKTLEYALKLKETPCLYMQKARIQFARQDFYSAARYCAQAVKAGMKPEEDSLIFRIDSLSSGGVRVGIQRLATEDKKNDALRYGLEQMEKSAVRSQPSEVRSQPSAVSSQKSDVSHQQAEEDSIIAEIPFLNQTERLEMKGKINGLPIRLSVDTTATESSISGVETMFMLKNEYISKADIHDNNTAVMIKRLEIGESVVLNDITLQHRATQEQSVILCMGDLERLGRIRIDDKKRMLVIYK